MSYYKGGRGSGGYRGGSSYRGSRGGESSWRGSRGSSFASSSRGSRYSSYPSPTYDSRSRSSYGGGAADRYSRGARDDAYHRYSQEVGYSTRDYGRGMSPEPPRKRARPETSPTYMAPRRSHERSFASEYSSGRSYYDKGGASSSAGGYLGEKTYTREVRERGSEFAFRKPAAFSSPRGGVGGGYRGRSGRGLRTRGFRSTSSFLRKRDSFAIRKRAGLSSRSDYIRRLKQLRLRRRLRAARRQKESDDDDVDDDEDADDQDDEKDEEGEEEEEEEEGSGGEEEATSGEEEEEEEPVGENEGGDEEAVKVEKSEGEAEIKEDKTEEDKEKKEGDDEPPKKPEAKAVKKKVVKKTKKKAKAVPKDETKTEGDDKESGEKEKEEENDEESEKPALTDFLGQPFIKLKCPHCHHICVTFKEYSKHLETRKHQNAMQGLFTKLRKTLASMRMEQRKKQRVLDEECKAKNMRLRTFFCSICKLNYRTLKSHHQASASHRKMSEFLLPFCKVCRIWFKSAWSYESHLCELPHIKRKARIEKLARPPAGKDDSLLGDQEGDLDTSSFMVLDSVGSGDDSEGEKSDDGGDEKKEEAGENDKEEKSDKDSPEKKKKKKKSEIKLGAEFCKMVEVYYCDLCKIYLPRLDDRERALTIHCRSRTHLQRYVRLNNSRKDDASLRRKAVRLHKERQKLKEKEKKEKKEEEEPTTVKEEEAEKTEDTEEAPKKIDEGAEDGNAEEETKESAGSPDKKNGEEDEEKMWSEVDKDLSELLHDGDEPHDDDEEIKKERYDRFKQSDKHDKNSLGEAEIKANGALPTSEKKKILADDEEK